MIWMCTANLIVTNNEAQHFPGCRSDKNGPKASEMTFEPQISQLLFDRVLCVLCILYRKQTQIKHKQADLRGSPKPGTSTEAADCILMEE